MGIGRYKCFADMEIGQTYDKTLLVLSAAEATTKNGKNYSVVSLSDGSEKREIKAFDYTVQRLNAEGISAGTIVDTKISVDTYNGAMSLKLLSIAPTSDQAAVQDDFLILPPVDRKLMYDEICEIVSSSANTVGGKYLPLSDLAIKLLTDFKKWYVSSSASIKMHHDMLAGLLYHSYRMVKAADALCGVYSELDRELMVCGAALHDLGKIWEYKTSPTGDAEYSPMGVLYGHIFIGGYQVLKRAGENSGEEKYSDDRLMLLVHLILSHHGKPEWGAVAKPAVPEAFALHYIDNLDAKIYASDNGTKDLKPGTITHSDIFGLSGRGYNPKQE